MDRIIAYLKGSYAPVSIIVYGSYADGSNNANSDFDALVISEDHQVFHDVSFVDGVQLDVFVYPVSFFKGEFNCDPFVQLHDGQVLWDTDGFGAMVKARVLSHLHNRSRKSRDEINSQIAWCRKMFQRTKRGDAEGLFRWHWVLIDSLEIFCDTVDQPYWGPKKTLRWMESAYPDAFACYQNALYQFERESLEKWIVCLEQLKNTIDKSNFMY